MLSFLFHSIPGQKKKIMFLIFMTGQLESVFSGGIKAGRAD